MPGWGWGLIGLTIGGAVVAAVAAVGLGYFLWTQLRNWGQ